MLLQHRTRSAFSFLPRQPVHSILAGRHASRIRGRGLNFEELRDYLPGDDVRSIDWKVTARTGKPHVRVFTEERDRPALLVVDTMDALAAASREVALAAGKNSITCVVVSHRDLYYAAKYSVDGNTVTKNTDHQVEKLLDQASVLELADSSLVCGPGARQVDPKSISGLSRLSSRFIALEACRALSVGETTFTDPMTAEPLYRQEMSIFAPTLPQSRKT